jgi:hypothetical protein
MMKIRSNRLGVVVTVAAYFLLLFVAPIIEDGCCKHLHQEDDHARFTIDLNPDVTLEHHSTLAGHHREGIFVPTSHEMPGLDADSGCCGHLHHDSASSTAILAIPVRYPATFQVGEHICPITIPSDDAHNGRDNARFTTEPEIVGLGQASLSTTVLII